MRTLDARADGVVAARLGLEESTPLIYLERLRLADDEPLAMDRVWLPARLAAPLLDAGLHRTALYDELDRRCGVRLTGGREQVRAVEPDRGRGLLNLPDHTAALAVDRTGELRGQPVEWRQTVDEATDSACSPTSRGHRALDERLGPSAPHHPPEAAMNDDSTDKDHGDHDRSRDRRAGGCGDGRAGRADARRPRA